MAVVLQMAANSLQGNVARKETASTHADELTPN
jgi:hypothetical protein